MNYKLLASTLLVINLFSLKANSIENHNKENMDINSPSKRQKNMHPVIDQLPNEDEEQVAQEKFNTFAKNMKDIAASRIKYQYWHDSFYSLQSETQEQLSYIKTNMLYYIAKINKNTNEIQIFLKDNHQPTWSENSIIKECSHKRRVSFPDENISVAPGMEILENDRIFLIEDPEYKYNWFGSTFRKRKFPTKHKLPSKYELPLKKLEIEGTISQYMEYLYAETAINPIESRESITTKEKQRKSSPEEYFHALEKMITEYAYDDGEPCGAPKETVLKNTKTNRNENNSHLYYDDLKKTYVKMQAQNKRKYLKESKNTN